MANRIVQERFVTIKKHNKCSLGIVIIKKNENKIIGNCTDNAIGINNQELILTNVLQNVENRNEAIKGTINFDATSGKGFKVNFSFPV